MKRTGFTPKPYTRPAPSAPKPVKGGKAEQVEAAVAASPKQPRAVNRHLLDMARGKPCLLLAVSACETTRGDSTVAAHSNWVDLGGKGAHRKADDSYSLWACGPCHVWLDQGSAPKAEKRRAWMAGHERQIAEWRRIADGLDGREQIAAEWALDQLGAHLLGWPTTGVTT